jgi:hypothetical protein
MPCSRSPDSISVATVCYALNSTAAAAAGAVQAARPGAPYSSAQGALSSSNIRLQVFEQNSTGSTLVPHHQQAPWPGTTHRHY